MAASGLILLLGACHGPVWPSFALEVPLDDSTPREVAAAIQSIVSPLGYRYLGKDGRDELEGTLRNLNYGKGDDIILSVGLDDIHAVPVRLSYSGQNNQAEATADFEALQTRLLTKWPKIKRTR